MGHPRLTSSEVEAATLHLPGGAAPARLLEEKDRNQVFGVVLTGERVGEATELFNCLLRLQECARGAGLVGEVTERDRIQPPRSAWPRSGVPADDGQPHKH